MVKLFIAYDVLHYLLSYNGDPRKIHLYVKRRHKYIECTK